MQIFSFFFINNISYNKILIKLRRLTKLYILLHIYICIYVYNNLVDNYNY